MLTGALFLTACASLRQAKTPMPHAVAQPGLSAGLLVLLPGLRDRPGDFLKHAFVQDVPTSWRVVAADAHLGYYRNRTLPARLEADVITPQPVRGPLALAGISLGGMGSVLYFCETRDPTLTTLVLLSPFLGDEDIIEQLSSHESLKHWQADPEVGRQFERKLWRCLIDTPWNTGQAPRLWLAFGTEDDLRPGHELLASLLDDEHVERVAGGHDWPTWRRLWAEIAPRALGSSP